MKKIILLIFLYNTCNAQEFKVISFDSIQPVRTELGKYDYYFIGESSNSKDLVKNKFSLLSKLFGIGINNLFIEQPILNDKNYDLLFNLLVTDTTDLIFSEITKDNETSFLLKRLYSFNQNIKYSDRIQIKPIDIVITDEIDPKDIIRYYPKKQNKAVKRDLNLIKDVSSKLSELEREKLYLSFYDSLTAHKEYHLSDLGIIKYNQLGLLFEGLKSYIASRSEKSDEFYKSKFREEFMFQNICDEIKKNDSLKFVSFNDYFHIPLNKTKEWMGLKDWESLAYLVKMKYPQKKVCSIYFMNLNEDIVIGNKYFLNEKKLILENTKPGETYLIKLDGEDTPFKELSEKFQYIVVW